MTELKKERGTAQLYFPSKKDFWLGLVIWGGIAIPFGLFLWKSLWIGLLILTPLVLFAGWIWLFTGYTVTGKELVIQSGPFSWKIPLESIRKVSRTNSPISAPALSLRRLEIAHGHHGVTLVSPADIEAFIEIIRERCPKAAIKM